MDNLTPSLKVQLRAGTCKIRVSVSITEFALSFAQIGNQESPVFSAWKTANSGIVSFNCFLRTSLAAGVSKCNLKLWGRRGDEIQSECLGQVDISCLAPGRELMKKYLLRDGDNLIATIDASLFVRLPEFSLPQLDSRILSQISSQTAYSSSPQHEMSLESVLYHCNESSIPAVAKTRPFTLSQQFDLSIKCGQPKKEQFGVDSVQSLLAQLFEKVNKGGGESHQMRLMETEKESEADHIKMKDLIVLYDERKVERLKKRNQFLLAANETLLHRDQHSYQAHQLARSQRDEAHSQLALLSADAALKIMCLNNQLEAVRKQLEARDRKVTSLLQQAQNYTREINQLKIADKEKTSIITRLKIELGQTQIPDCQQQALQLSQPNKKINKMMPVSFDVRQSLLLIGCSGSPKASKCRALSLFQPQVKKDREQRIEPKLLRESAKIPFILKYLLAQGGLRDSTI